jgi:hypothetical protein
VSITVCFCCDCIVGLIFCFGHHQVVGRSAIAAFGEISVWSAFDLILL